MKDSTKKILIIGGVAGVAGLAWWWFTQRPASTAPGTVATEQPAGSMSSTLATPAVISVPASGSASQIAAPSGIDPAVEEAVEAWGDADGRTPVLLMINAKVPSEYQGIYGIIQGGWKPTAQQTAFWNALRAKYDGMTNPRGTW